MPRKRNDDLPAGYADNLSAPKGKAATKPDRSPRVAKVSKPKAAEKDTGKAPAKARNSAAPAAAKPAATADSPAAEKQGTTVVKNPIELNEKQLEALALAQLHGLNPKMAKFVDLYLVSYNQVQSYRDAGYTAKNDNVAAVGASKLLKKVKYHPYYAARQAEIFKRTADVQNATIGVIHAAAFADPREISELRRACCRYCYGIDNRYQHTPREMERRRDEYDAKFAEAEADNKGHLFPPFDELGGLGYDKRKAPQQDCPECAGEGIQYTHFHDSRGYSPAAVALYGGVEETKDGLKIRTGDQKAYRELVAKIFDLHVEPAVVVNNGPDSAELDAAIMRAHEKTEAARLEMQERRRRIEEGNL